MDPTRPTPTERIERARARSRVRRRPPPEDPDRIEEVRRILLGADRSRLEALEAQQPFVDEKRVGAVLPEAIGVATHERGEELGMSLEPVMTSTLSTVVRRESALFGEILAPAIGSAVKNAVRDAFAAMMQRIDEVMERSLSAHSLVWRIESWRTGRPFAEIVLARTLVFRVEQVFLIHRDTGLLLAHVRAGDLPASDADLISGMLTAIRDFVADSFSPEREAGGLRRFSVGELTVLVEQGPQALLAAVVRGVAPDDLVLRLQDPLETIHLQFAGALAEFDGDRQAHPWTYDWLWSWVFTIAGGTSEILREITADRLLGLPRAR